MTSGAERLSALELKYPRNGQVPESMFSFCKDIAFLEQLVLSGFQSAYFLAVADHKHFYAGASTGIYGHFRSGAPTQKNIDPRKAGLATGKTKASEEIVSISAQIEMLVSVGAEKSSHAASNISFSGARDHLPSAHREFSLERKIDGAAE